MIHRIKGFSLVNKAEIDVFLELSCFFDDPADVGNLFSGSLPFLKPAWTSGSSQLMYCWSLLSVQFSSVQLLSCIRLFATPWITAHQAPCPSPTPAVHSDSHPSSQWCHQAISSSVIPFSSCPQSLPASESFPMSQLFAWGGQSTEVSALASFFPKKSQGWFSEWTSWISLQCII